MFCKVYFIPRENIRTRYLRKGQARHPRPNKTKSGYKDTRKEENHRRKRHLKSQQINPHPKINSSPQPHPTLWDYLNPALLVPRDGILLRRRTVRLHRRWKKVPLQSITDYPKSKPADSSIKSLTASTTCISSKSYTETSNQKICSLMPIETSKLSTLDSPIHTPKSKNRRNKINKNHQTKKKM